MHWKLSCLPLLSLAMRSQAADCTGIKAVSPHCATSESAYFRDTFYIGGHYLPYNGSNASSIFSDVLYVEKLTPLSGINHSHPIVLISAGVPTGAVWLNTPDNRKGWASYFLDHGYPVYIIDITSNGRSGQNELAKWPLKIGSTDIIHENDYTAPQDLNPYPQSQGHDKWPGTGLRGDPIFDAFFAAAGPISGNSTALELTLQADICTLLSMVGPSYTICHSAACTYTAKVSDQCPELHKAAINLEPGNTPFQSLVGNSTVPAVGRTITRPWGLTNTEITYDPPISNYTELKIVSVGNDTRALRSCYLQASNSTIHTLPQIAKVPYIMYTASASPHITYDHCMALYLSQTGVPYEWIKLGELPEPILGNAHFMYIETNNLDIAKVVEEKIQELDAK